MRPLHHHMIVLAVLALTAVFVLAQTQASPPSPPSDGTTPAPAASVRILAPKPGEKLAQTFIIVQYEVTNPAASAGTPNFQVQLDSRDAIVSTDTKQDFSGLEPGQHTVVVQLVDANKTPIAGSRVQLQFVILPPPQPRSSGPGPANSDLLPGGGAAGSIDQEQQTPASQTTSQSSAPPPTPKPAANQPADLPKTGSILPLISLIGVGALVGGIYSALKTR
jgi:hypothetical protein